MDTSKQPRLVGNYVRGKREALNISQKALGMKFEPPVTTQFISNVERGVTPLPPAHVPTIAKALGVEDTEIFKLLEQEFSHKLSGRLGMGSISSFCPPQGDCALVKTILEAYKKADATARLRFADACKNVLNVIFKPES